MNTAPAALMATATPPNQMNGISRTWNPYHRSEA